MTHVLLSASWLVRRADAVTVIGAALLAKAAGAGHRVIAPVLGRCSLFTAWVETVYHQRVHSETGQAPIERFLSAGARRPCRPRPCCAWRSCGPEHRQVTKTATVSLHGNTYQVEPALTGRRVELVFDPFDLTELAVRYEGRDMGTAIGHQIGRQVHPAARAEAGPEPNPRRRPGSTT